MFMRPVIMQSNWRVSPRASCRRKLMPPRSRQCPIVNSSNLMSTAPLANLLPLRWRLLQQALSSFEASLFRSCRRAPRPRWRLCTRRARCAMTNAASHCGGSTWQILLSVLACRLGDHCCASVRAALWRNPPVSYNSRMQRSTAPKGLDPAATHSQEGRGSPATLHGGGHRSHRRSAGHAGRRPG